MSSLTLGTVQLGIPYGINNQAGMPTYEESANILGTALDLGIVSFDTAKGYGESESVLGRFFGQNKHEKTIISKVFFKDVDKAKVRDRIFADVRDSLKKLGLQKLPFLKLHNESMLLHYGDTIVRALEDLKAEGLVCGVGISFSDKSHLLDLTDGTGFDIIQMPANMFDNKEIISGSIETLAERGIAVFIRSVYLQGLFFKDTNTLPEKIMSAKPALDKLHELSRETGISIAELAITFIRDTEGITSLILGCDNSEQVKSGAALINAPSMPNSVREEIINISESVDPVVIRPWEWFK